MWRFGASWPQAILRSAKLPTIDVVAQAHQLLDRLGGHRPYFQAPLRQRDRRLYVVQTPVRLDLSDPSRKQDNQGATICHTRKS